MAQENNQQDQQLQVHIDEKVSKGVYANLSIVSYTENEFVLDFAFIQPSQPVAQVNSRVVINPKQAKRLALILSNGVVDFEEKFGTIDINLGTNEKVN